MMRWPSWPSPPSKKFWVAIMVHRLMGLGSLAESQGVKNWFVEIKWKGQRGSGLSNLRRSVNRNLTKEGSVGGDGDVEWDEEFFSVCTFSGSKEDVFHPWEIDFTVFNGVNQGRKGNLAVVGTASVNLADFAPISRRNSLEINVPVTVCNITCNSKHAPSLSLTLRLVELRTAKESTGSVERSVVPVSSTPPPERSLPLAKDDLPAPKAGPRKAKTFKDYVSFNKRKKTSSEEQRSNGYRSLDKSNVADRKYQFETDSSSDDDEEFEEGRENSSLVCVDPAFAYARCAGAFCPVAMGDGVDETCIYYRYCKPDECSGIEGSSSLDSKKPMWQNPKLGFFSWRKRNLSFRSPKAKGEPLLKTHYREDGGDDIDFDRRLAFSNEPSFGWSRRVSEFGDDVFAIGSWELRDVMSRDGRLKLRTQVFFASIDQRSESAAGESACTALVAMIADWLHSNEDFMPVKSEFDSLIREGSLEWRNLCENEAYREKFPDKHFDLETVLQANICPVSIIPEKSFIGFFHPEGLEGEEFDFLNHSMSFDTIWEEINRRESDQSNGGLPLVYIVSWNDHFFILKVEEDAYYIIDTLGERLFEGCNQAYILKFDKNTTIYRNKCATSDEKNEVEKALKQSPEDSSTQNTTSSNLNESGNSDTEEIVCSGKDSCKEYIKGFLAAIPIRELQADVNKGLKASAPLHHRLQIEFHCTQALFLVSDFDMQEL